MVLREDGGYESEKEEDTDSMPSLEDVSNEDCGIQGELLLARKPKAQWEDSELEEHAVQGELLVAIDSTTPWEVSDEEDEEEQGVLEVLVAASSTPPLEDKEEEEHAVQGEVLDAASSLPPVQVMEGEDHADQSKLVVARRASNVQIKEDHFKDLEHYDFIGIEPILSRCCSNEIIGLYLRSHWIRNQFALFAMKMSKHRPRATKYSRYLFRWRGRCQYWSNKDPVNSRTNSFQEWGNDVNMAGLQTWNADPIQVLKGKAFQVAANGLIQEVLNQACPKRPGVGLAAAQENASCGPRVILLHLGVSWLQPKESYFN